MGTRLVLEFNCDNCGETSVDGDPFVLVPAQDQDLPNGWLRLGDQVLCPSCVQTAQKALTEWLTGKEDDDQSTTDQSSDRSGTDFLPQGQEWQFEHGAVEDPPPTVDQIEEDEVDDLLNIDLGEDSDPNGDWFRRLHEKKTGHNIFDIEDYGNPVFPRITTRCRTCNAAWSDVKPAPRLTEVVSDKGLVPPLDADDLDGWESLGPESLSKPENGPDDTEGPGGGESGSESISGPARTTPVPTYTEPCDASRMNEEGTLLLTCILDRGHTGLHHDPQACYFTVGGIIRQQVTSDL
jgi:hypothetical protein